MAHTTSRGRREPFGFTASNSKTLVTRCCRAPLMGGSLAKMWHRSLLMLPARNMLLASRGMFREQDEALAQLQELDPLARFVGLSCGVCAGLRLVEIVPLSTHVSDSLLSFGSNVERKTSFHWRGRETRGSCKKSVNAFAPCNAGALMARSLKSRQLN